MIRLKARSWRSVRAAISEGNRAMTPLRRRFSDDLKAAETADDACRAETLRLILATLADRDAQGAARGGEDRGERIGAGADDAGILGMLATMVRRRRDSIAEYERRGRRDLAAREAEEIAHIERYMPRPLDNAEIGLAVAAAIAESRAASLRDAGRAMAALKARYAGRMDFAAASRMVKTRLAGGA